MEYVSKSKNIPTVVTSLIDRGEHILQLAEGLCNTFGCEKFKRKVKNELKFFKKLSQDNDRRDVETTLKCTNLPYLEALIDFAATSTDCIALLKVYTYSDTTGETKKLAVDIVSNGGAKWTKISARNPKWLTLNTTDDCSFGTRSIIHQVDDYLRCAQNNHHFFKAPEVNFHFANGIEETLAKNLTNLGVSVTGSIFIDDDRLVDTLSFETEDKTEHRNKEIQDEMPINHSLNLDISAMMAYVSSCTNGGCYKTINSAILAEQALQEQTRSVKKQLDQLFEGKHLVCCKTAMDDFQNIVNTVAGRNEKNRVSNFLEKIHIVPDNPSKRSLNLKIGGRIKERSIIIFGTGDNLKIPTVSSNAAFIRASGHQGVNFVAHIHDSRALTECKEGIC